MPRVKQFHYRRQKDGYFHCEYLGHHIKARTEEDLEAKKAAYKSKLSTEAVIRQNPTVGEYVAQWLPVAKAGVSMSTYNNAAVHLDHLTNRIGNVRVKDVRPSDIKSVYSTCYLNVSDQYIRHAKSIYTAVFRSAMEDGLIRSNPVTSDTAKPHKGKSGGHRSITPEERELIETIACDSPMHVAAIIMLYAGLRPQEVKALRMEDIDTRVGVIRVHSFVHTSTSNEYTESEIGKNANATREVPLFPPVEKVIAGRTGLILHTSEGVGTVAMWRKAWETYRRRMERHLNGMQKRWYGKTKEHKALLAEGKKLPPWKTFTVTPYDLRHSFASWCRDNGVELHTCVEWMGHTDATMILKIYDEVSSSRSKSEAEKLIQKAFPLPDALPEAEEGDAKQDNQPGLKG